MKDNRPYILGLDVGVASLGLALIDAKSRSDIIAGAVRVYSLPVGASERREKRGMRRSLNRRGRRLDRISNLLCDYGIGYNRRNASKKILNYSPIKARAKASREKVSLDLFARAILHMAKHRGSSAFDNINIEEKEKKLTAKAMRSLETEMKNKGFNTYGQYLRWREKNNRMTRIDQEKHKERYGEYAFYPSRDLLKKEFEVIWEVQARHYKAKLTTELKQELMSELFFQRTVTFPPPGSCPYFTSEDRLPKANRLFQIRRIYEECNNLRFYSKNGDRLEFRLDQRDILINELMDGKSLTATKIKKLLDFESSTKVNIENNKLKKKIEPCPIDIALGDGKALGDAWLNASESIQDKILDELATEPDSEQLIKKIMTLLKCAFSIAETALTADLPRGRSRLGQKATTLILNELKKDLISAREAEDLAGISHVMSPDGEVWEKLPYYGEILLGHTQPAIWASDYRRPTDTPPNISIEESKFGRIPNPVVHIALNQIRKTVNRLIEEYGIPEKIHIELARDLNKSAEQRSEIESRQKANQEENKNAAKNIKKIGDTIPITYPNKQKYKLWKEQSCTCIYTGESISCTQLFDGSVEIDHILPRSKVAIDAFSNKAVCLKGANSEKKNKSPYQAFSKDTDKWAAIMRRAEKLPAQKQRRFSADAMDEYENDPKAWAARYGTDNAYIARVTRQYLSILFGGDQTKIVCVSSHIVALLRGKWGLQNILGNSKTGQKYRGDHRHHFIDALVTAFASRSIVQRIQNEAARCETAGLEKFVEHIDPPIGDHKSFFNAVKAATEKKVLISRKAEHGLNSQMHEDRLLGIVTHKDLPTPDKNGSYLCRKKIKLSSYNSLPSLNKVRIQKPALDLNIPEVEKAFQSLKNVKKEMTLNVELASKQLKKERDRLSGADKIKNKVTVTKVYKKALEIHEENGGQQHLTVFEFNKLVNIKSQHPSNIPVAGYIGGRNHRIDLYKQNGSKLRWECISVIDANKIGAKKDPFTPNSSKKESLFLWSAYKDDVIEMDDPEQSGKRSLFLVVSLGEKMGVAPIFDARATTGEALEKRRTYQRRLTFFKDHGAQKVILDEIGNRKFSFPKLS